MEPGLKKEIYSSFTFGDMTVRYLKDERENMELLLIPKGREDEASYAKISRGDSLIQVKLIGDMYPGTLSGGTTMRNSETTELLKFVSQELISENEGSRSVVKTVLTDGRNHLFVHYLGFTKGDYALDCHTEFINGDDVAATLEMLSSFSLSEISPFEEGEATECFDFYRVKSKWSHEGRLIKDSAENLQLEMSWVGWHVNSERYGSIGSMPVKRYSPFGAVEDKKAGVVWAAQLLIESSWEMEFYRRDEAVAFSGGLADREFGQWTKEIKPGESFSTPVAILTVCDLRENGYGQDRENTIDYACQRLTHYVAKFVNAGPESEQHLPVLFNEYCTTWGLPSYDNIDGILKAIKGHGLEYFVIDCGWFVEEGKSWGDGMGDYIPSNVLFPNGLKSIADRIREDGLKPGIWYEIDNVGCDSNAYNRKELLHTRDGITLTTKSRRFFDMRKKEVTEYLDEKVIKQLKECGFEYMKMDYNDTAGLGFDSYDENGNIDMSVSLSEGLRQDREAGVDYVRRVKEQVPGIILENCASGGHKTELLMMSLCSMASFSDAHECSHIPSIAGGLHRCILPRQSQIWAVIRKSDDLKRITWTLTCTLLGRMCFSGDVTDLSDEQWNCIDEGIAFYKEASGIIKNGYTHFYDHKGESDRNLTGWQAFVREETEENTLSTAGCHRALVTVYNYGNPDGEKGKQEPITIKLPKNCPLSITKTYSTGNITAEIDESTGTLTVKPDSEMEAMGILLG